MSDGIRTRDIQNHNPIDPRHNLNPANILRPEPPARCSAGRSDQQDEGGIPDAELAALVSAWPTLPAPIKAAIRALVGTVFGSLDGRGGIGE